MRMRLILAALFLWLLSSVSAAHACPLGFVPVHMQQGYTSQHYCIMQYEARNVGGVATSTAAGVPWTLSHNDAQDQCEALGVGYGLPINDLWQEAARQAELVASNWSGGEVGHGTLAADVTLPNGSRLYDFGDSVWEHVAGHMTGADISYSGRITAISDRQFPDTFTMTGSPPRTLRGHFGTGLPLYNDSADISQAGYMTLYSSNYIMRGGDDSDPGMFGTALNHGPSVSGSDSGFRCACSFYWCG